jgi:hypothetical protein
MNQEQTAKRTSTSARPLAFAIAYFSALLIFAGVYYSMPDTDFHHQSIKFEPSSVAHLDALKDGLNSALQVQRYSDGPYGVSVSFTPVYNLTFPARNTITFSVGYYYYYQLAIDQGWPALISRCGPSEKQKNFYLRTLSYRMTAAASSGGRSITVRSETPQLSGCDLSVLQLLYHSIEKTPEGFQAMVAITPQLNALLEAVSEWPSQ